MRSHPHLYEIHTFAYLNRLSAKYRKDLTLTTIPDEEWEILKSRGMDLVWLMGVWQRSPEARRRAQKQPDLCRYYDTLLPDRKPDDIVGSAYAIHAYELDPKLGKKDELAKLKEKLGRQGLGLILDFVPNHLAMDHPWTLTHPDRFIQATKKSLKAHPDWFFETAEGIYLAHGKDPYFPPWTDTVQVNFFSKEMRQAMIGELLRIADVSGGVRCDMAMLGMNDIFRKIWGDHIKTKTGPAEEFWVEAIQKVKKRHPEFIFIAEVYWDLEWDLQQLGFDFTYDKRLYDRMMSAPPADIHGHLQAELKFQNHLLRFIENHDESRSPEAFGKDKAKMAAVVMSTVPGLRFYYDGQWEGRRIKLPVQFAREPAEKPNSEYQTFYRRLLGFADAKELHSGKWNLLNALPAWNEDQSYLNILAWMWHEKEKFSVVIVNFSPEQAAARLPIPVPLGLLKTQSVTFRDGLSDAVYDRTTKELLHPGLYVNLAPWSAHLLQKI